MSLSHLCVLVKTVINYTVLGRNPFALGFIGTLPQYEALLPCVPSRLCNMFRPALVLPLFCPVNIVYILTYAAYIQVHF